MILSYLEPKDLIKMNLVNKHFYDELVPLAIHKIPENIILAVTSIIGNGSKDSQW